VKIERIELWSVAVPLPAPFRPAWIPGLHQTENRFDLVRLCTASGVEGWSAVPALGGERRGLGSLLGSYLLGERADDIASVRQRVREMGYLGLRMGWIEPACWDIVGKARGKPVYELLGGKGGKVRLYASSGEVRSGSERAREVEARLSEGFKGFKLRVHAPTLEEDLTQIRETRRIVGDGPVLGIDANQGWRVAAVAEAPVWDLERALAFCREAEALGYSWVEEPLPMDDYDGLASLTAQTGIRIAGGELNGQGLPELRMMIARRCYDVVQPDAVFTGGIAETWSIARHAAAAGLEYTPHTWTNGIGFAVNLQLLAGSGFGRDALLEYPFDPPAWVPEVRDGVLAAPWHHRDGELQLPEGPGLGFEIDRGALRRWGQRFYVGTRPRVAVRAVWDRGLTEARRLGAVRGARLAERSRTLDEAATAGRDPVAEVLGELEP
jgi:L-alanine-DL-glutamate epimerase-like enolase superfamily enzyme